MSDVIVGAGRQGDFVHANQKMGTSRGFKNVSGLWLDQTLSYDAAFEQMETEVAEREDITEDIHETVVGVNEKTEITLSIDGRMFRPTLHALLQLATWLGVPHTMVKWYLSPRINSQNKKVMYNRDASDVGLVAQALRLGFRHLSAEKNMLFRTYKDGTLRAVLSDIYGIIDNRWYLQTLSELLPDGRVSHWRGDADTIFSNILIPDTIRQDNDSDYGGMLSIGNCEIGKRVLEQYPSVFRAICMNGCIWDQTKGNIIRQVHRGEIDFVELRARICENVHKQIPLLQSGVDRFLSLRNRKVAGKLSKLFACIAKENGMSNPQANRVIENFLKHEKNDRNAFGVINAITRAGQEDDNDNWLGFDMLAGKLMNLNDSQWSGLLTRAESLDDKVVEKVFAMSA